MGKIGFYIFNHFIAYYGLTIVIGLIVAFIIAFIQTKRNNLIWNDFIIITSTGGLFGIIGAKILYIIVSFHTIDFSKIIDISYLFSIMQGGFVFYGGLIGGLFGIWTCQKFFHIDVQKYIQYCITCLPIVHGFGRIGCYIVGCCYGIPYEGSFCVIYHNSFYAPNNISLFPIQLVEAIGNFIIALFLFTFSKKMKGYTSLYIYILIYAIMRFFLEFMRNDSIRGLFYNISTSQIISIMIIVICCKKLAST